jgi:hypothetical protein
MNDSDERKKFEELFVEGHLPPFTPHGMPDFTAEGLLRCLARDEEGEYVSVYLKGAWWAFRALSSGLPTPYRDLKHY